MTACVNKKSKRVAAVVTASLVGALSIGAPAVALATGVSTLSADEESSSIDGTIVSYEDGFEAGATFTANGEKQGLVPTMVQPWGTSGEDAQVKVVDWYVYKLCDKTASGATEGPADRLINGEVFYYTGSAQRKALPSEVGNYAVFAKVTVNGQTKSVKSGATFSIVAGNLADAKLYEVNAKDTNDLSDEEFVFDLNSWDVNDNRLGIKIGDTKLSSSDFDIEYYDSADKKITSAQVKKAGSYTAVLTAKSNSVFAGQKAKLPFEIKALDLSKASVVIPDVVAATGVNKPSLEDVKVNGAAYADSFLPIYTSVSYSNLPVTTGKATLTIAANDKALAADGLDGSIVNSVATDYSVVGAAVDVKATYGTSDFTGTLNVDFSANPTNAFDASKVSVSYVDPKTGKDVSTDKYTLRVTDKDGKVGGVEMLSNKGTYTVEVVLDAEGLDYAFCNENVPSMTVNVTKGVIASADIAFAYKDAIVSNVSGVQYLPGHDVMGDIAVTVKTANGELGASEYTVKITKSVDGKNVEVDKIVDAGNYTVTVEAEGYTVTDENTLQVMIDKRDLSTVQVRLADCLVLKDKRVLPYTGEVIAASYEWSADGGKTWFALPADDFTAAYTLNSAKAELKQVGEYKAKISAAKKSANYASSKSDVAVEVTDTKVFADVPNGHWGAQGIYDAYSLGYMNGYEGTTFFGPSDSLSRAQAAVVLFNMGTGNKVNENNDVWETWKQYGLAFPDAEQWYAAELGWAAKLDIVNGYPDGNYGGSDDVTREQFAAMLRRYAAAQGKDVSVKDVDAALKDVKDAGTISSWHLEDVAWAVENGIMGKDGYVYASSDIERAQAALMTTRFQPEALGEDDLLINGARQQ